MKKITSFGGRETCHLPVILGTLFNLFKPLFLLRKGKPSPPFIVVTAWVNETLHEVPYTMADNSIVRHHLIAGGLIWVSHQFKDCSQKNQEKAETQKGSNRRIRKDHQEQRCH